MLTPNLPKPTRQRMRAGSGVNLIDIHPSPSNVKAGSNFELLATVVNNSPDTIMLPAGRCDSPLTAFFMGNVVIRQDQFQGCTATSSPFELNQGEEVKVAGPVPGTIYQAIKAGKTSATATVYYLTENGSQVTLQNHFYSRLVSAKTTYFLWKKMTKIVSSKSMQSSR